MYIGELCKRKDRGKKGETVLLSQYGTIFQYSECIVILIWPLIRCCIIGHIKRRCYHNYIETSKKCNVATFAMIYSIELNMSPDKL